jgi:carbamoyltransferase
VNILSMNFNHDGAAVVLRDGHVAGFVNTERFSRIKKQPGVRREDVAEVLAQAQLRVDQLDLVVVANHGLNYPEIVERYGRDFKDTWVPLEIEDGERTVRLDGHRLPAIVNPAHLQCHAAAAFYFSPFEHAAVLACDPLGCEAFVGRGRELRPLNLGPSAIGNLYHLVSAALLRFGGLFGAGKTMGLAPYGEALGRPLAARLHEACAQGVDGTNLIRIVRLIEELGAEHPAIVEDGSQRWNATVAWLAQEALEIVLDRLLAELHAATGVDALCLSGGTALNSVANQRCYERSRFERLYLHPACGDDGTAIGAALLAWHGHHGRPRQPHGTREAMYSVRTYGEREVREALAPHVGALDATETERWVEAAADALAGGAVVGWFQGASEIGPRALGHRSIVADPSRPQMRDRLNRSVKKREAFRPFAPSVLAEHASAWFEVDDSPFMLRAARVRRPGIPAVTHVDGTARVQTVSRQDDAVYHRLIDAFRERTGVPLVLNTSFNVGAEPIVETPADAVRTFLASPIDQLVFPGFVVRKREQGDRAG